MTKPVTPPSRQAQPPVTDANRNKEGAFKDTTTDADRKGGADSQSGKQSGVPPVQR